VGVSAALGAAASTGVLKDHLAVLEAARQRAAQLRARIASSGQATTSTSATLGTVATSGVNRPAATGILKWDTLRNPQLHFGTAQKISCWDGTAFFFV
jgi:hypothetical protein